MFWKPKTWFAKGDVVVVPEVIDPDSKCKNCGHVFSIHHTPPWSKDNDPMRRGYPAHLIEACSASAGWSGSDWCNCPGWEKE